VPRARVHRWLNWVLILVFLALRVPALLTWSPTWDEPTYVGAGKYMVTHHGEPQEALGHHPPLAFHLTSLSLWGLDSRTTQWDPEGPSTQVGLATLYESYGHDPEEPVSPRFVLTLARLPVLFLGLIGMELVRRLGLRLFDARTGWIAAAAWAVHPDVAAHGVLATTDLLAAVAAVLLATKAVVYDQAVAERSGLRGRRLLELGAAAGLALLSKHSLLVPLAVTAAFLVVWRHLRRRDEDEKVEKGALRRVALACGVAFLVLWTGYLFELKPLAMGAGRPHGSAQAVHDLTGIDVDTLDGLVENVPVPAASYVQSIADSLVRRVVERRGTPWEMYLDGEWSQAGFLAYFPVALLVKTPSGLLLLMLAGLAGWWQLRKEREHVPDYLLALIVVPFAAAVLSQLNLGTRLLLPIVPFALLLGAAVISRQWMERPKAAASALAVIGLLVGGEWAVNARDPLAFANVPSGGPERLHERLADSNLDWGQDFWAVVRWGRENELEELHCRLFLAPGLLERQQARDAFLVGRDTLEREADVRAVRAEDQSGPIPKTGLVAVSETEMVRPRYARLAGIEPLHRIGRVRIYRLPPR
jgi:4-amino-4-deoxy-L-arabinose transferase-like glycosyltransferase